MLEAFLLAAFLGIVEGLTEFLPVSSTGHLILANTLLGFEAPANQAFDVVIQLGAILAICVVYFGRLWRVAAGLPHSAASWRFVTAVFLAFLPAAVLGAAFHGIIKSVLFNPTVVSVALIAGGFAILAAERAVPESRHGEIEGFSPSLALRIGLFQCLSMVPGVSRSGATILGSLLMGVERRTAAEFSFFLAIPTMAGATAYDLYKNWGAMNADAGVLIAIGFVTAFLSALVVVRTFVGFVGRYGFGPFAWYRIAVGTLMLGVLYA
jgi:undecaprenyl-diphosphatase